MFAIGAIVSLCYVPGLTGAYIATQWPVLAIILPFGLLRDGPVTAFHWLGIAFVAYATALMFVTPAPYASVFGLWLICIMGLSLWFGTTMLSARSLYAGLALGGAVSSAVAVFQYLGFGVVPVMSVVSGTGETIPAGIYVNSVQQGAVLALLVVALVSERMWFWVLPLLPGIVLAGSRGAWLMLAVGLLGCAIRRAWLIVLIAMAGVHYLSEPLSVSDQIRMSIWDAAEQGLTWFGWGPGIFYTVLLPQADGTWFYPEYAHNDALQLLFEYGAGALLAFVIFGFALSRTASREWPVVLAFIAAGCYSMPLWMPITSFLGLVAVGRVLRDYALGVSDGGGWRLDIVPWARGNSGEDISVEQDNTTEG